LILILNHFGKWQFDCDFKLYFWQMICCAPAAWKVKDKKCPQCYFATYII
jgi:hypothetical protein